MHCRIQEKIADTSSSVLRERWQTQAVLYSGEDGRHKQCCTQEKMADNRNSMLRLKCIGSTFGVQKNVYNVIFRPPGFCTTESGYVYATKL